MTPKQLLIEALIALCEREGGYAKVAEVIEVNDQTLYQIVTRRKLPSGEPRGVGPSLQRKLEEHYPGWTLLPGVAQPLSHQPPNLPPLIEWEANLNQKNDPLPKVFRLAMPDGSLVSTPRGTVLFFSTEQKPRPGWGVLFKDRHGHQFVRRYVEVRGDHWMAEATAPGYSSFDSVADELTILAAMTDKMSDGSV